MPIPLVFAAFCLLLSTSSFAGHLSDVLQRMSDADQNQNYRGTFILRKSDDLSTLRVTHGSDQSGIRESLEALNGEPKKIVRHDNTIVSIFPKRELLTIRHNTKRQPLHWQLPENTHQLENSYAIKRLADDRIADHPTFVLDLLPDDKFRYGYRYWVDKNTGMLLRCDLLNEDSIVVEQMMFTSLEYLEQAPQPAFDLKQFKHYQQQILDMASDDVARSATQQWAVNNLPKGFMLTQSTMRYSPRVRARNTSGEQKQAPDLLHLVYSDGLASVSVFIEKNQELDKHRSGASSMGVVNAFGRSVGEYFVTVVGGVPVKTVQIMAQSTVKLK